MEKHFITILAIAFSSIAYSQVGINTPNPQGSFHVDGAKDNPETGAPTATQSLNDVVVTNTGSLGIGTAAPVNKLHVIANTPAQGAYNLLDAPGGIGLNGTGILRLRNTSVAAIDNITALGFSNNGPTSGGPGWQIGTIRTRANINTGEDFYFSSSNGFNQIEHFRINSLNGNVGIATADPTERIDVAGGNVRIRTISTNVGTSTDRLVVADTNGILKTISPVVDTDTNIYNTDGTITGGNRTLTMGVNSLIFNSTTGNFQINGNTDGLTRGFLRNLNTGTNSRTDLNIAAGTGNVYLGLDNGSGIFGAGPKGYLDNRSGGRLVIANNGNEHMTVDNTTGNVGIGTASPVNKLHVVANTPAQGAYNLFDASVATGGGMNSNGILRLRITSALTNGNAALISFSNNGPTSGGPSWQVGSIRTRPTITGGDDFAISVSTGGGQLDRLRIDANTGNVGIGTIAPNSKLQVTNGDVYIENAGSGIIMKSPNGTCRRVTITDAGAMSVSAVITCP